MYLLFSSGHQVFLDHKKNVINVILPFSFLCGFLAKLEWLNEGNISEH